MQNNIQNKKKKLSIQSEDSKDFTTSLISKCRFCEKHNTSQISIGIYKQRVTTITKLVMKQNFVKKKTYLQLAQDEKLYL